MNRSFFKGRSRRTKIFTLITACLVVLVTALTPLIGRASLNARAYIDLTPERLYTISDRMDEVLHEILTPESEEVGEIEIIFCTDPDYIVKSTELRTTYFMALGIRNRFDNVSVKTVNLRYNPTAVSRFKTTSRQQINASDIIITYGQKYRIASAASFWTSDSSSGKLFSYNGEYKLANILASLTAINAPGAYFVTDHGESYYDAENPDSAMSIDNAYFADLLTERGLAIKTLKLSEVDKIPEDCALLIINNPKTDLGTEPDEYGSFDYVSEAEKIDAYLVDRAGSLIVNKPYDSTPMPVLESLMREWGIGFGGGVVSDEERLYDSPTDDYLNVLGVYDKDDDSFGSAFYGDYAKLSSAPDMIFKDTGYVYCSFTTDEVTPEPGAYGTTRTYASFIGTTDGAIAIASPGSTEQTAGAGFKSLAAVSTRRFLDSDTAEDRFSYVFASNSEHFYSNEVLGNPSFANYDVMSSVITSLSRTDRYVTTDLGGTSLNSPSYGGKQLVDMELKNYAHNVYSPNAQDVVRTNRAFTETARGWFLAIAMIAPTAALVTGIVVFIRRKYL